MDDWEIIKKAKRRIRRFLRTGKPQHRISICEGEFNTFTWRGGATYGGNKRFRVDKLKRIYVI